MSRSQTSISPAPRNTTQKKDISKSSVSFGDHDENRHPTEMKLTLEKEQIKYIKDILNKSSNKNKANSQSNILVLS